MNNSPYLDKPALSERERRLADALRSCIAAQRQSFDHPDRRLSLERARALLAELDR